MRDASPVQVERDIARCRVILSVAAPFAVYLDPTEPTLMLQLTGGPFILDPYAFVVALAMMYAVNALGVLRVSTAGELQGRDLHEHGIPAYPEYALHLSATPSGAPAFTEQAFATEKARTSQ